MSHTTMSKHPWGTTTWVLIAFFSILWWVVASHYHWPRLILVVALALASFMVGCAIGFLFTSYGEEAGTVGKVKDWVIGGLAGLTIAEATSIKTFLVTFTSPSEPNDFALMASMAIIYTILGFFFMFFQRELILNVVLAESRLRRGQVEGTRQAGLVMTRLIQVLPVSMLLGIDNVDETGKVGKGEADKQRRVLYSDEVDNFLQEANDASKSGVNLDWDVTSKVANLHYYRIYFESDKAKKTEQAECAYTWIERALVIFPGHVDLRAKLADTLWILDRKEEAILVLESLASSNESPAYVKEWLGFYLLDFPNKLDLAIEYSEQFHAFFPEESDSLFNIAYAYLKKYCAELLRHGKTEEPNSEARLKGLQYLREGKQFQPEYAKTIGEKWTAKGEELECLANDEEFRKLTGLPPLGAPKDNQSSPKQPAAGDSPPTAGTH